MMSWDPLQITTFTADKWAELKMRSIPFWFVCKLSFFSPTPCPRQSWYSAWGGTRWVTCPSTFGSCLASLPKTILPHLHLLLPHTTCSCLVYLEDSWRDHTSQFLDQLLEVISPPSPGSHWHCDPLGLVSCLSEQRKLWHEFIWVICYTHYKYNDELRPIADHHIYSWQMNYVKMGSIPLWLTCKLSFL